MSVFIYTKSANDHANGKQVDAARAMAKRRILDEQIPAGGYVRAAAAGGDNTLRQLLARIQYGDTLIVPSLDVLATYPTELVEIANALFTKGVRLLSATDDVEIDPITLRRYTAPWFGLEQSEKAAADVLRNERQKHRVEIEEYGKVIQEQIIGQLLKLGVDFHALLASANGQPAKRPLNPSRARDLRSKREALGLTQEDAGKLVVSLGEAAIGKGQISKYENDGDGPHIDTYELALNVETSRRKTAKPIPQPQPALE
ncbi:recombinase family protein [Mesorhizobium sp. DCY119]|uniref:recombinase family protein n=1 Tax=Mesorhizobium sp. DCY119 TaxID=2108445 RepID=UPI000E6C1FA5|nr:recombinase family protein [Mesorhizobium sp. DCY119]RJG45867.1 hypothetical protein D3Y55_17490 [Mesorhizobium sp. DCY119]